MKLYVYTVYKVADGLQVKHIPFNNNTFDKNVTEYFFIHVGGTYDVACETQPAMNVFAGDFDGDGKQEIATVNRTFPGKATNNMQMRVNTFKYDSAAKSWATGGQSVEYQSYGSPRATRADVDGDGRDEIVVFLTLEQDGTYYPELEMWYFNQAA